MGKPETPGGVLARAGKGGRRGTQRGGRGFHTAVSRNVGDPRISRSFEVRMEASQWQRTVTPLRRGWVGQRDSVHSGLGSVALAPGPVWE